MKGPSAACAALLILFSASCVQDSSEKVASHSSESFKKLAPIISRSNDELGCSRGDCVPNWQGECHQVFVQFDAEGRLRYDINPLCGSGFTPEQVAEFFDRTACPDLQEFISKKSPDIIAYALYPDGRCWPALRAVKTD